MTAFDPKLLGNLFAVHEAGLEFILQPYHRPCWVSILCEISAIHVRERTIAVPYMINPDQADLAGKIGLVFGGLAALSCVWAYFRVPETQKNRTYQELDLIHLGINARDFATYWLEVRKA
ncbi:hypothetical protein B0H67DRAFT_687942 [Lasiosphaeris hirsuta]|uniref:Uncharacterized protein n=1 Tax=Lasiosphaeris hirsuta TaxID=260670 RepID=A0AA39ZRA7_9PEZI|nr:hypothetical protein B0H67DRAFT_687942 [Lasiosphaeris hirsuta]